MRLEYQILAAIGLDLLLGDPRWLPHPVKLIGRLAASLEAPLRRWIGSPRLAGVATALIVLLATALVSIAVVYGTRYVHPVAGDIVSILLLYTTLAIRDMMRHSMNVYRALKTGDLAEARRRVSMIVGRDTDQLDEAGVVRAAVESVAENTVDGVAAPLFFGILGGPVAAMVYKAINTLDSTFGYKNERYMEFGWASARIDDAANFIPARLTAPAVCAAAALVGHRPGAAMRTLVRDGRKHPSPNSGLTEAAMAGALGVQLGGLNYYFGQPSEKPRIGDAVVPLERNHIRRANGLMLVATALCVIVFFGIRWLGLYLWQIGRGTL